MNASTSQKPRSEGRVDVPGGKVWYQITGNASELPPVLVVNAGPGLPHNYALPLEDLADRRQVIFWDQLGCGNSDRPSDPSLWTLERSLEELSAVLEALNVGRCHIFGNAWGGMLAQQYVLDARPDLASLIVSNSLASMPRFSQETRALKERLPSEVRAVFDEHEKSGDYSSSAYKEAMDVWNKTHLCRMDPWPDNVAYSMENLALDVYHQMIGPNVFYPTGGLRDWNVFPRLSEISVPTLFVSAKYDECIPEHMKDMHEAVVGSELVFFEDSSHFPFNEERERFMSVVNEFMARHD